MFMMFKFGHECGFHLLQPRQFLLNYLKLSVYQFICSVQLRRLCRCFSLMPVSNFDLPSLILRLHNFTDIGKRKPEQIAQIFNAFKPREVSFTVASIISLCTASRRKQTNFLIVTQRAFSKPSTCRYLLNRKEALFFYIGHHAMHLPSYSKRLCAKVVVIRLESGLTKYTLFLLSALVKRSQTTL